MMAPHQPMVAVGQPIAPYNVSLPACTEAHAVHQHAPESWLYRSYWRRMYCYNLVGMEAIEAKDCGVYQCHLPRGPGQPFCGDVIKDRGCTGQDLESHLAQYHNVSKLPQRFQGPSRDWSSGMFCCHEDPMAALDCLFCSCCFLSRVEKVSNTRWEKGVIPYVMSYRGSATGCDDNAFTMCIAVTVLQPIVCLFAPLLCCGFADDDDDFLPFTITSGAIFRTKHNANIDEDQCTTKCKMLWCCPLQACQTYRELRSAGVNPGLTCCTRSDEPLSVKPQPTPTLGDILEANGGPVVAQNLAPGQWAPTVSAAMM
jgi:hypothetical protein